MREQVQGGANGVKEGDWVFVTMASPNGNFNAINMGLDNGCNDGICRGPQAFVCVPCRMGVKSIHTCLM
jgi:hypothetical protein